MLPVLPDPALEPWALMLNTLGANEKDLAEVVRIPTTTLARRK